MNHRHTFSLLPLLAVVSLAIFSGCGSARRSEAISGPTLFSGELANGEALFMRYCHECHPVGEAGLGPGINDKPLPAAAIRMQTRAGVGAMPSFSSSELPDRDLDAIIRYLESMRARKSRT